MSHENAAFLLGGGFGLLFGLAVGYLVASHAWSRRLERLHERLFEVDDVGLVEWPGRPIPEARR